MDSIDIAPANRMIYAVNPENQAFKPLFHTGCRPPCCSLTDSIDIIESIDIVGSLDHSSDVSRVV